MSELIDRLEKDRESLRGVASSVYVDDLADAIGAIERLTAEVRTAYLEGWLTCGQTLGADKPDYERQLAEANFEVWQVTASGSPDTPEKGQDHG